MKQVQDAQGTAPTAVVLAANPDAQPAPHPTFFAHVYLVVRVKVAGMTGYAKENLEEVVDAVVAGANHLRAGMDIDSDHLTIEHLESAEEVSWVLVDQMRADGEIEREHHFDARLEPMAGFNGAYLTAREAQLTAREAELLAELEAVKAELKEAQRLMKVTRASVTGVLAMLPK